MVVLVKISFIGQIDLFKDPVVKWLKCNTVTLKKRVRIPVALYQFSD